MKPLDRKLTAAELVELARYLELGGRVGLHELTGFFAALATTPEMVAPSAWLPEVLPPDGLGSLAAVEGALELVMRHYNHVLGALAKGTLAIPEKREARQAWCSGYLRAGRREDVFLTVESDGDDELDVSVEHLFRILLASGRVNPLEDFDPEDRPDDPEAVVDAALAAVPEHVAGLYEYWRGERSPAPPRRPAKIGRNDPCPCGSGKKYKRCCLT